MERWLTTKEVAAELGVTYVRVNQLITSGQLPAEKHGRDYFIKEEDLAAIKNRPERRGRPPKKKKDE